MKGGSAGRTGAFGVMSILAVSGSDPGGIVGVVGSATHGIGTERNIALELGVRTPSSLMVSTEKLSLIPMSDPLDLL